MLSAQPNVPHVLAAEVAGLEGTRALVVLPEPGDRCLLWIVGAEMAAVQLNLAGVLELQALLGEVAAEIARKNS